MLRGRILSNPQRIGHGSRHVLGAARVKGSACGPDSAGSIFPLVNPSPVLHQNWIFLIKNQIFLLKFKESCQQIIFQEPLHHRTVLDITIFIFFAFDWRRQMVRTSWKKKWKLFLKCGAEDEDKDACVGDMYVKIQYIFIYRIVYI